MLHQGSAEHLDDRFAGINSFTLSLAPALKGMGQVARMIDQASRIFKAA